MNKSLDFVCAHPYAYFYAIYNTIRFCEYNIHNVFVYIYRTNVQSGEFVFSFCIVKQ